jgi:2,4-dienoyl-CoA reductase-like NADH-dependent reductase (Old Yellow Enzyme family)/thioredoxin reductase
MALKHLLVPLQIGSITIRNRIVFAPVDLGLHTEGRAVDPRYADFLSSIAESNGVGLIISEFTSVANDRFWVPASRIYSDEFMSDFKNLVERIHSHGTKIFMQLAMLGGRAPKGRIIAPSAIESPLYSKIPEELTREEIRWLIQKWVEASLRAQRIGYDGVEVHGGHSYLLGEFMSPHANRRDDEYGSDFEGRMRMPSEIIREIKAACGDEYTVGIKFSAYEALENGITAPLSVDMALHLETAGADYLHVSSSTYMLGGTKYPDVPPMFVPEGPLVELAARIKKRASVPVLTVAGITTPEFAEEVIARSKADMVAIGRAMFADLHWVSKAGEGRESEITPCIRCNVCHKKIVIDRAGSVECTVNPGLLREREKPASTPQKIIVVGAGPAGLEAALQAAEKGHSVYIYEKSDSIGGNITLGCIPPFKLPLRMLLEYYKRRLDESSVNYLGGHELTPAQVLKEGADVVIVAVGAEEHFPGIQGLGESQVITAREFYKRPSLQYQGSGRVAVIGAGSVGCEIAWYLSLLGRKVYLMDILPYTEWMSDDHPTNRFILLENLDESGVQILDNAAIVEVGGAQKYVKLKREDVEYRIFVDGIILAAGYRESAAFSRDLRQLIGGDGKPDVYEIGDCVEVRDIHWAIREGYEAGIKV